MFQGQEYGAGDLTYDEVYHDTLVFNTSTNEWDLVTDATGDVTNLHFARRTHAQQVTTGCVDEPGDDTNIEVQPPGSTPSRPVSTPTPVTPQVPTVVDAGLAHVAAGEGPVASSGSMNLAAALAGAGFVLLLCAGFTRRRPAVN